MTVLVRDINGNSLYLDSVTFTDNYKGESYIRRKDTLHPSGKISGLILSPLLKSVGGTQIVIYGTGMMTTADDAGHFSFEGVPKGELTILSNKQRNSRTTGWPRKVKVESAETTDAGLIVLYCDNRASEMNNLSKIVSVWDTAGHFVDLSWSPVKWRSPIKHGDSIVWQDTLIYDIGDAKTTFGEGYHYGWTSDTTYRWGIPQYMWNYDSLRVNITTYLQNSNSTNRCRSTTLFWPPFSTTHVTIHRPK